MINIERQISNLNDLTKLFNEARENTSFKEFAVNLPEGFVWENVYDNGRKNYKKTRFQLDEKWLELYIDPFAFMDFPDRIQIKTSNNNLSEIMGQSYFERFNGKWFFYPSLDEDAVYNERNVEMKPQPLENQDVKKIFESL